MNITNCLKCGKCYEESSEEQANSPSRECLECYRASKYRDAVTGADQRATAKLIAGLQRTQRS